MSGVSKVIEQFQIGDHVIGVGYHHLDCVDGIVTEIKPWSTDKALYTVSGIGGTGMFWGKQLVKKC